MEKSLIGISFCLDGLRKSTGKGLTMNIMPQEMMMEMMNNCPMGFMVVDSSHHIVDINKHGAALFEYHVDEMIGQDLGTFVGSKHHKQNAVAYIKNETHQDKELQHNHNVGQTKSGRLVRLNIKIDRLSNGLAYAVFYKQTDFMTGDKLTGALSREEFYEEMIPFQNLAYSLLFIDLNKFKEINDTKGHQIGDVVLETVGKRIANILRDSDIFCRYGGDEFIIVIPGAQVQATVVSNKVRKRIAETITTSAGNVNVGSSIGIAYSEEADTLFATIELADKRMYDVKSYYALGLMDGE